MSSSMRDLPRSAEPGSALEPFGCEVSSSRESHETRRPSRKVSSVKRILGAVAILAVAFGVTTWWALESDDVAIVETRTADGTARVTHVWYSETNGALWLEAGTPENGWFRDVLQNPALNLTIDGRLTRYVADPIVDPSGHQRIRSLMREKYGFRDRWVNLIVDTSRSVAVRLIPESARLRSGSVPAAAPGAPGGVRVRW